MIHTVNINLSQILIVRILLWILLMLKSEDKWIFIYSGHVVKSQIGHVRMCNNLSLSQCVVGTAGLESQALRKSKSTRVFPSQLQHKYRLFQVSCRQCSAFSVTRAGWPWALDWMALKWSKATFAKLESKSCTLVNIGQWWWRFWRFFMLSENEISVNLKWNFYQHEHLRDQQSWSLSSISQPFIVPWVNKRHKNTYEFSKLNSVQCSRKR